MKTAVEKEVSIKQHLSDILLDISWAKIAKKYFGKSPSWVYHKLDGIDGNGGVGEFTYSERIQLRTALIDLSERIRIGAERIEI